MSRVIRQETVVFLLSVLHGILLTFGYDLIRAWRRAFRHGIVILSVEDVLFWLIAAAGTFLLSFFETGGVIRGYVAAGIVLGIILYHFTVSALVLQLFSRIFCSIKHIFGYFSQIICKFVKKTGRFFEKIIEFIKKRVYNGFRKRNKG